MFAAPGIARSAPTGGASRCWAGNLTDTSFSVKGDCDQSAYAVRIVVSINADLSGPVFTSGYQNLTTYTGDYRSYRSFSFDVTGLTAGTLYYYQIQSQDAPNQQSTTRSLTTAPARAVAAAFTFVAGSCSKLDSAIAPGRSLVNSVIHRAVAQEASLLFFLHLDDPLYTDITSTSAGAPIDMPVRLYLSSPDVDALMHTCPTAYIPGDHDMGPNDATLDTANAETIFRNHRTAYRGIVPYYPFVQQTLGETNIDHVTLTQQFDIAKVRFLMLDCSSQSKSNVTALGHNLGSGDYWDQLTWLGTALTQAATDGIKLLFLCLPRGWQGYNQVCFNDVFTADRTAISDLIEACSVPVCLMVGDTHCCADDDGTHAAAFSTDGFAKFPQIQASGMFNVPVADVGVYSWNSTNTFVGNGGASNPNDGQYKVISVSADNLSWTSVTKGVPINLSTFAPTTLKTVSSLDVTPAVSFNNAAPSVAHGSPLTVNLDCTWFQNNGTRTVHWASSDGQSGNVSFLPNK